MRTVNYLMLPGGFSLPAALVTDTYSPRDVSQEMQTWEEEELLEAARRYVREQMTAGVIVSEETEFDGRTLTVTFGCRELIGVFRPGSYMERDTNERENGER